MNPERRHRRQQPRSPNRYPYCCPANNDTISGGNVTISASIINFNGVGALSGYINYYIDSEPPVTAFQPAVTSPGSYITTASTSYTWTNVSPDAHTFSVLLVNPDLTPVMPAVGD